MDFKIFMTDAVEKARHEMKSAGYQELITSEQVDGAFARNGITLCMVNSVCGCAGGTARPAAASAIHYDARPDHLVTVFAGQDKVATERARSYFGDNPPSSPSFALLKDGECVAMLPRHEIEGSTAIAVIDKLQRLFDMYCEEI